MKDKDQEYAICSLGIAIAFLEEALLSDSIIRTSDFNIYQPESIQLF
jgi:hypothetical protein